MSVPKHHFTCKDWILTEDDVCVQRFSMTPNYRPSKKDRSMSRFFKSARGSS